MGYLPYYQLVIAGFQPSTVGENPQNCDFSMAGVGFQIDPL